MNADIYQQIVRKPTRINDLVLLEMMFDVLDVYLWLSYRFPSSFVEAELVW